MHKNVSGKAVKPTGGSGANTVLFSSQQKMENMSLSGSSNSSNSSSGSNNGGPRPGSASTGPTRAPSASVGPSSAPRAQPAAPSATPAPASMSAALKMELDVDWFYLDKLNNQTGPVTFQQLKDLYTRNEINENTHVFGGEMENWQMIKTLPKVKTGLNSL